MQFVIMSDTHGDMETIQHVKQHHPNAVGFIHCGDSELPAEHPYLQDMTCVGGNCDRSGGFQDEQVINVEDTCIYVTHGHLYDVKSSLMRLSYRAQEVGAQVVCFGHSHLLGVEMIAGILYLNPGSLLLPRGRKEKSYITLEILKEQFIVHCYDHQHHLLETVSFER